MSTEQHNERDFLLRNLNNILIDLYKEIRAFNTGHSQTHGETPLLTISKHIRTTRFQNFMEAVHEIASREGKDPFEASVKEVSDILNDRSTDEKVDGNNIFSYRSTNDMAFHFVDSSSNGKHLIKVSFHSGVSRAMYLISASQVRHMVKALNAWLEEVDKNDNT